MAFGGGDLHRWWHFGCWPLHQFTGRLVSTAMPCCDDHPGWKGSVLLYVGFTRKLPEPKAIIQYLRLATNQLVILHGISCGLSLISFSKTSGFKRGTISEGFRIACQVCSDNIDWGLNLWTNISHSGGDWSFRDPVLCFPSHHHRFPPPAPLSICRRRWSKELASSGSVLAEWSADHGAKESTSWRWLSTSLVGCGIAMEAHMKLEWIGKPLGL